MSEMTASDAPVLDLLTNMTAESVAPSNLDVRAIVLAIGVGIEQASAQMADDELN